MTCVLQSLSTFEDSASTPVVTPTDESEEPQDLNGAWLPKPFDLSVLPGVPVGERYKISFLSVVAIVYY